VAVLFACAIREGEAPELTLDALLRASFIGHDSVGLALVSNGRILLWRKAEPITEAVGELKEGAFPSGARACLGHLRWATHGVPYEANTHPLLGCSGDIALAHNGIIENCYELRGELLSRGHRFVSKTDSEALVHMLEEQLESGLSIQEAIARVLESARGSISMAFLWLEEPSSIFCACKNSRLFIARGPRGYFCSSELSCLYGLAKGYLELGSGEAAILRPSGVELFSLPRLDKLEGDFRPFEVDLRAARGQGHPHVLLREIYEQAFWLENSLRLQRQYLEQMARLLASSEELFLVGDGPSYNACLAASYLFSSLAYQAAHAVRLVEFINHYGEALNVATTILVADASGQHPKLKDAITLARARGATILAITNRLGSFLTRMARLYLCQHSGPPLGVASMRTFTAQVLVFIQLALEIAVLKGKIGHVELEEHQEALLSTPSLIKKAIEISKPAAREAAREYASRDFFFILGRGLGYPTALEGLQKLMEVAGVPGISYPAGESKHGPISLVEEGFPVIFICQMDETHDDIIGNIMEMKARGASVIAVAEEGDSEVRELADTVLPVPGGIPTFLTPLIYVIPLQLFAYYSALARGLDPDEGQGHPSPT